jgi:hypothetical protein
MRGLLIGNFPNSQKKGRFVRAPRFQRTRIVCTLGTPRRSPGRLAAMPGQPPRRHRIDDLAPLPAQLPQASQQHVGKRPQRRCRVIAVVPLEAAPLPLLGDQLGAVPRQRDDLQARPRARPAPPERAGWCGMACYRRRGSCLARSPGAVHRVPPARAQSRRSRHARSAPRSAPPLLPALGATGWSIASRLRRERGKSRPQVRILDSHPYSKVS